MIGASRAANGQCRHTQISKRLHPGLEYRRYGFIALQVHTPDGASAVINVEVCGEFRMFRLQFHIRAIGKVLRYISTRAEEAFFFSRPKPKPDCSPHFESCGFQDAHGFHDDCGACRIVRRARAGVPGIEVRSEHHEFVGFIRSRDLCDDVEGIEILIEEFILDVHLEPDRNILSEHSPDAAVVFDGHDHLWRDRRVGQVAPAAALYEDRAPAALAWLNGCSNAFVEEELEPSLIEIRSGATSSSATSASLPGSLPSRRLDRLTGDVLQLVIGEAVTRSLKLRLDLRDGG